MWKLTIKQERKSEHSSYPITEKVQFISDDMTEITMIIERLSCIEEVHETTYKIEKVGDE